MNTTNLFRLGAVVLLGGALVAALFIFNDDDEDTVERRDLVTYFDQVNVITEQADTTIVNLQSQYANANVDLEQARAYYPQFITIYQTFVDEMQAVDAPGFIAAEHQEFVEAARAIQARNRSLQTELDEADEVSDLDTIFARTDTTILLDNRRRHACVDLGDIARQYRIDAPSITSCTRPIEIHQTVDPTPAPS